MSKQQKALNQEPLGIEHHPIEMKPTEVNERGLLPVSFPIIGLGASAGGLEAFEDFFNAMPAQSGMAFVIVQHLQPTTKSILDELIRRFTTMTVSQVEDGVEVEPDHVYIIAPDHDMALFQRRLHLFTPQAPRGQRLPIDVFFRSLASDLGGRAIGIILSGTGSDGTVGVRAIAGEGGMVMAQDPQSAQHDGMPRSAINTDVVNYVLAPKMMPAKLLEYVQQSASHPLAERFAQLPLKLNLDDKDALQKVFLLLRLHTSHDFSYYKRKTIGRRIERRMIVTQRQQLTDYVRYLQQNPLEIETLFRDLLIGVTHFFRDREAFEIIRQEIIPKILKEHSTERAIRIWVAGCSTGEEAYSLSMLFYEELEATKQALKVQIFATDIDDHAIEKARAGIYPDGISADVSPEKLQRFFTREDGHFVVKKNIRELIVFATQNVVEDPPFSKVDMISCRNLLIYLDSDVQKKILPLFHYALNRNGFLFLGNSETVGEFGDSFVTIDRKWKLFQRSGSISKAREAMNLNKPSTKSSRTPLQIDLSNDRHVSNLSLRQLAQAELLSRHSPVCILINKQCEILYIHGHTGQYLEPAMGETTANILKMARNGLRIELTTAIRKAITDNIPVQANGLLIEDGSKTCYINLTVKPITEPTVIPDILIIIIEDLPSQTRSTPLQDGVEPIIGSPEQLLRLQQELRSKEEYLQTTIEALETANAELNSSNEELQSSNEELQSTNEEMETTKEELQSVNEELMTVNTELQQKIGETSRVNDDLSNLLAGTQIGTIFVDLKLHIQRFTPSVTQLIPLIQSDIGRPINDIVTNLKYSTLLQDIQQVLVTLISEENVIETVDGRWYLVRISPYRTLNNIIEGAVITFVNISEQKRVEYELRQLTQVVDQSSNLVIIVDLAGTIQYINRQVIKTTGYSATEMIGRSIIEWLKMATEVDLSQEWSQIVQGKEWKDEWRSTKKQGGFYWAAVSIVPLKDSNQKITSLLVSLEDITERKEIERYSQVAREASEAIIVFNFGGEILAWNRSAEHLYGWRESEASTMKIFEMVSEENQEKLRSLISQSSRDEFLSPLEIMHHCRNGATIKVLCTPTILRDETLRPYAIATTDKRVKDSSAQYKELVRS